MGDFERLTKERDELRVALKEFIEHVEELNLLLAESLLRRGNFAISDETFQHPSEFTAYQALRIYEGFCRLARKKWDMPNLLQ